MNTIIIITLVVIAALVYAITAFNHACDKAEKERLENLPGVHFLYEDGTTCLRFYVHEEDGKVWLHDYGRKIMQPSTYDSMEQLVRSLKVGRGWKYKIIPVLLLALCFGIFTSHASYARDIEDYQRMAEEYKPIIEKADAVRRIENIFNKHVSEHLVESKNLFLKAILLWQFIGFYREVYELEVAGKAPWMRRD